VGNKELLDKTIKYVDGLFGEKDPHFVRALHWALQIDPDAVLEVQIAAYAHDVERALYEYNWGAFLMDEKVLKDHQENGARAIHDFLIKEGSDPDFAARVKAIIEKHEVGGTYEQNIVKDADSISYFETNALKHVAWAEKFSAKEVRAKFDWMWDRMTFDKAKDFARSFYEEAVTKLKEKAKELQS
jgi:hypothetical protein